VARRPAAAWHGAARIHIVSGRLEVARRQAAAWHGAARIARGGVDDECDDKDDDDDDDESGDTGDGKENGKESNSLENNENGGDSRAGCAKVGAEIAIGYSKRSSTRCCRSGLGSSLLLRNAGGSAVERCITGSWIRASQQTGVGP